MSKYLANFPEKYRSFVYKLFSQAYVFSERAYVYGQKDEIELAPGPETMKLRVQEACTSLTALEQDDTHKKILKQVSATVDDSMDLLLEIKETVDKKWKEAEEYRIAHPPKPKKAADKPSDKQLNYLKRLGCVDIPKTKAEASRLIDIYNKR